MRRKLTGLLLVLSLALNVFFVAGVLSSGALLGGDSRTVGKPVESQLESLRLTEAQRADLEALRERSFERREAMKRENGLRGTLLQALETPSFEPAPLAQALQARMAARRAFFIDTMADLHAYLATLGPDQKSAFLELAKERRFLRRLLKKRQR